MKTPRILPLAAAVGMLFHPAYAAENPAENEAAPLRQTELKQIRVSAKRISRPGSERFGAEKIQEEMIRDTRDLVRYTTDAGISDNGRHLKGFSIRGVEGNRVGISVDGVNLPDSEENSLYARYGNFNPSRLSVDSELVRSIDIVKGADSFESGSGSLGGTVNYRTLEAQDIVAPDQKSGVLLRSGYASKNREWAHTAATAYAGGQFDALVLYSQRYGHEMKSRGRGKNHFGSSSQHPDPAEHRHHSYLAKLGYQFNPEHRAVLAVNGQSTKNHTVENSYALFEGQWRNADDRTKRINLNVHHEYAPESGWLALLRTDIDYQRTRLGALNDKGGRHWLTNERETDEMFDRRMETHYKRLCIRVDSQTLDWGRTRHKLSFKAFMSRRDFQNINHDTIGIGRSYESSSTYTIQYPMRTTQYGASLSDSIVWNPNFSSRAGIRYDREKAAPQELNAPCSKACTAEGKAAGKSFGNWSGFAGLDMKLNDTWKTGYMLSSGYRVPTASEMYFTFTNPYGTWKSNPDLKAERSLSHTLSLQGEGRKGRVDVGVYHSRYRDFLFESENLIDQISYGRRYQTPMMQMVNLDTARIYGLEFKGRLNLHEVSPLPQGWKLSGSLGYSRSRLSNGSSLLSLQPLKAIVGLDYEQPEGRWGVFSRLTYFGSKKPRDAQTTEIKSRCAEYEYDYWYDEEVCTRTEQYTDKTVYKYLNKAAWVADLYGFYKPSKNLILRAGIYNAFNRKYHSWDALRGINAHSTTNSVDSKGEGLQRYYAPGRNYAFSLEYKF